MSLTIKNFFGQIIDTNAYLVIDNESGNAIVVDVPNATADQVLAAAKAENATIELIVITHSHWDHIGDAARLREATGLPVVAHELAKDALLNPTSRFEIPFEIPPVTIDRFIGEGDEISFGEHVFQVLHVPGHEVAHIALYSEPDRVFIGGDVLFPGGHGRVDIPGADQATMNKTLARLAKFPADVVVYPGHGRTTTIGAESSWMPK
jgi:glyoxylase-like metal-dependent hydrolase (beta-lactamase superfamily II)